MFKTIKLRNGVEMPLEGFGVFQITDLVQCEHAAVSYTHLDVYKRQEVGQARKRIAELDRIFKRIYEDDINGTISHERFLKLSAEYEAEQKELTEKVKACLLYTSRCV